MMAVNRQLNHEMEQAIYRARTEGILVARIDCMVEDSNHYFTWLSLPLVHNSYSTPPRKGQEGWGKSVPKIAKLLASPQHQPLITRIETLQIDVRLFTNNFDTTGNPPTSYEPSPSWAICTALQKICDQRGDVVLPKSHTQPSVTIDTLILNVIRAYEGSKKVPTLTETTSAGALDRSTEEMDYAKLVAHEMINVWTKLWSGHEGKGRKYSKLLGRIQRVRVCLEGVLIRERELRLELDRGQEERRRIARRVGW